MFNISFVNSHVPELSVFLPAFFQIIGFFVVVIADRHVSKKHKATLIAIAVILSTIVMQNISEFILAGGDTLSPFRVYVSLYGYIMRPVILMLFIYIIDVERKNILGWVLILINAGIYSTALYSKICFYFTPDNKYQGGPLGRVGIIITTALIVIFLYSLIRKFGRQDKKAMIIPIIVVVFILLAILLDYNVGLYPQFVTFLTHAMISTSLIFYIWLHFRFGMEHERILKELQNLKLMTSQIKPHFIFNCIGAIEEMCVTDPEEARSGLTLFSKYLRNNLESISATGRIPFEKELDHIKVFLELEKMRFEEDLQVSYDIRSTDFSVPVLSIEPIVENAVRHGVRGNADGKGHVNVAAWECDDHFRVSVSDDGPGFDPKEVLAGDDDRHIGLQNARIRLEGIGDSRMIISSEKGKGTTVTVLVPKDA